MSFQDVQRFAETMRILQYPRIISIQSFQRPNFELVADVLYFMVQRYDTDITIHDSIDTEHDRVLFITSIVKAMYHKANIKLNAKKLYSADGHAVKELLEFASVLCTAIAVASEEEEQKEEESASHGGKSTRAASSAKSPYFPHSVAKDEVSALIDLNEVKKLRKLASELTEKGANVFELLRVEKMMNKSQKEEALKFLDGASAGFDDCPEVQHIETTLVQLLERKKQEVEDLERECKVMESDKNDLLEEMKKKTVDLERNKKRLESIKNARPAFMDEYEQLEVELQKHYELYMERYRNVHYLKKEMEKFLKEEEWKSNEIQRSKRKIQSQLKEEELKILRDEHCTEENNNIDDGVPLLDTTDDSSLIIIQGDEDDDKDDGNVFLEDDDNLSIMPDEESSFGISQGTGGENSKNDSQSIILSSKGSTSSFSDDDETEGISVNRSSDSNDIF